MNATCVNMLKICNVNPMMSMHAYICVEYFASICRIYNLIPQTYIKPCFYIFLPQRNPSPGDQMFVQFSVIHICMYLVKCYLIFKRIY